MFQTEIVRQRAARPPRHWWSWAAMVLRLGRMARARRRILEVEAHLAKARARRAVLIAERRAADGEARRLMGRPGLVGLKVGRP